MRSVLIRLAALSAGVVIVASCDTRLPTATTIPTSAARPDVDLDVEPAPTAPTIVIDSPLVGALINVGDSVLVTVQLHDSKQLKNATIAGVTEKGSTDLGTFTADAALQDRLDSGGGRVPRRTSRHDDPPLPPADQRRRHDARQSRRRRHRDRLDRRRRHGDASHRHRRRPQGDGRRADQRRQHSRRRRPERLGARAAPERRRPHRHSRPGRSELAHQVRHVVHVRSTRPIRATSRSRRSRAFRSTRRCAARITVTATAVDVDRQPGSASPVAVFVRSAERGDSARHADGSAEERVLGFGGRPRHGRGHHHARSDHSRQHRRHRSARHHQADARRSTRTSRPRSRSACRRRCRARSSASPRSPSTRRAASATPCRPAAARRKATSTTRCVDSTLSSTAARTRCRSRARSATSPSTRRAATCSSRTPRSTCSTSGRARPPAKGFAPTRHRGRLAAVGPRSSRTIRIRCSSRTPAARTSAACSSARRTRRACTKISPNRILTRNTLRLHGHGAEGREHRQDPLDRRRTVQLLGPPAVHRAVQGRSHLLLDASDGIAPAGTHSLARSDAAGSRSAPDLAVRHVHEVDAIRRTRCSTSTRSPSARRCRRRRRPTRCSSGTIRTARRRASIAVFDTIPLNAIAAAVAGGSDAEAVLRLDIASLPLTDTTFAAASGNRNWIAFGEGHTTGAGRVIMVADSTGPVPNFFSPLVTISDLTDNASEQVFGLALDLTGAHGRVARLAVVLRRRSAIRSTSACRASTTRSTTARASPSIRRRRHADADEPAPRVRRRGERRHRDRRHRLLHQPRQAAAQVPDLRTAARERSDAGRSAGRRHEALRRQPAGPGRHRPHGERHQARTAVIRADAG